MLHANHAHHIALNANQKKSVTPASLASIYKISKMLLHSAWNLVEMEKDSNWTVMMEIQKMETVAVIHVKSKKDGLVQEVQVYELAPVFNLSPINQQLV